MGTASYGTVSGVADGMPFAALSYGSPNSRRQQTMDRSSSTEAPKVQVTRRRFLSSDETMNDLLNKIK
jgi:hypothetical protein